MQHASRCRTIGAMPQDVKLSPDGKVFYVADMTAGGVWEIDGGAPASIGFMHTGRGAHGLYPSRDARYLYVTNRGEGSISVISFRTSRAGREVADPRRRQPRHGRRLGRREGALGLRPLQRRRLRDLDTATGGCSRRSPSAAARTASASGRSPAATRSATPASSASRSPSNLESAAVLTTACGFLDLRATGFPQPVCGNSGMPPRAAVARVTRNPTAHEGVAQ